ncbi:hypothetical protein [Actinoplanes derwentensis]|uniref:Uncharacterized protein n=1 Tax=Actinoplanes derwentensis TaxID=113562 RepID=A0A1H1YBS3_9ACTN|nr:hypothetical protein [Actinoplanes derwentensis]GID81079.1 hypothetical protein Ade03nite_00030 [Actinoplanes derwentensis]SDT18852.1 hypothetical protein SAMN04489716_2789 [Actinoplanes derwentensis]
MIATLTVAAPVAGRSVTTVQTSKFTLASGTEQFTLIEAASGVQFRFAAAFAGDTYGKASSGTSAAVIIK